MRHGLCIHSPCSHQHSVSSQTIMFPEVRSHFPPNLSDRQAPSAGGCEVWPLRRTTPSLVRRRGTMHQSNSPRTPHLCAAHLLERSARVSLADHPPAATESVHRGAGSADLMMAENGPHPRHLPCDARHPTSEQLSYGHSNEHDPCFPVLTPTARSGEDELGPRIHAGRYRHQATGDRNDSRCRFIKCARRKAEPRDRRRLDICRRRRRQCREGEDLLSRLNGFRSCCRRCRGLPARVGAFYP